MCRRKYKKQIIVLCISVIFGIMSYTAAMDWLELYQQQNNRFSYGFEEIINVIFFRDDLDRFRYVDKFSMDCVKILLYFFIPAVFCIAMQNADVPHSYCQMIARRAGTRKRTLFQMHKNMLYAAAIFPVGFIVSVISRAYMDFSMTVGEIGNNIADVILICVSRVLFFIVLQEILFLLYLKWEVGISCFVGCLLTIIIIMLDIAIAKINFVLYHPESHFIDSLVISGLFLCMIRFWEKWLKLDKNIRLG